MDGLTAFALADVAAMLYWKTLAKGSTLRHLYDMFESYSVLGALNNLVRRRGDRLAVATLLCLVSALRGPLFQRATVVNEGWREKVNGVQEVRVAQVLPPGLMYQNGTNSAAWDVVLDFYLEQTPIYMDVDKAQCGDLCTGRVKVR